MNSDDKILIAKIEDKMRQCSDNSMITNSVFLDMHERSVASLVRSSFGDVKTVFYGGFADAERTVAVMLPDYIEADDFDSLCAYFKECPESDPLAVIEVEKDKFSPSLSHRDYLGALMGLGIKREVTGDIIVTDTGCKIAVLEQMAEFIAENLDKAGRGTLKTKIVPAHTVRDGSVSQGIPDSFTVSSMRLDSVVKNAFHVSRGDACTAIESGAVFVNDIECLKADKKIQQGDKIVFRRKGRIIVEDCSGVSKKGRVIVCVKKFI
ncbi:MAG: hypothetical protein IJB45_06950 [Clostridia bacterium]|nr:hypothetical protein [Clostridia bacterium]